MGLVKLEATAANETGLPTSTEFVLSDWIATLGGPETIIDTWVLAVEPEASVAVIVRLCVPASLVLGNQVKTPEPSMLETVIFELVILVPLTESAMVYVGLANPDCEILNETSVPGDTVLPGESD